MQKSRIDFLTDKKLEQEMQNRTMSVHGVRVRIPLSGRSMDTVFYSANTPNAPLLISIHGGGFLLGGSALDDAVYCAMKQQNDINIFSLDYRKGTGHPFPHALNDVYDEIQWILERSHIYQFDPKRVVLMGIGAGGLLALSNMILTYRRHDRKVPGILVFEPLLFLHCYDLEAETYGVIKEYIHLPAEENEELNEEIIGAEWANASAINPEMMQDPLFMPLLAKKEDIDPSAKISFVFTSDDHYMKWLQPFIHTIQTSGASVEWYAAPTNSVSGSSLDWSFLSEMIARLF